MDRREETSRIARIAASHAGIVAVYLFGSVAAERAHAESDLDVGILLDWIRHPDARSRFEQRVRLSAELSTLDVPADVVILNDAPPQLASRIVTTGIRSFCSNSEAEHAFRRDVQLKAADLEPFLRRVRRTKLEALADR